VVQPHDPKWHQRLLALIGFIVERALVATLRFDWHDESGLFQSDSPQPVIFCVWHNRLALSMWINRGWVCKRQPGRRLAALVSASKDGALLAAVLERFGVQPVRGSSSRRGAQALLELTTWAERGYDLAITPDGPRGPRYRVQAGAISLAQLTGLPIVPVTYNANRKLALKSWDKFQIPLPFTSCIIIFNKPITVPAGASDEEREKLRLRLEDCLRQMSID
jgi:lysophospholipid acyltransferase (LPLAT)-like uncharacterized protein